MAFEEFESARQKAQLAGGDLSYYEVGHGPAILFIHGVFMNGLLWSRAARGLEGMRRSILVDLPAHGHSPSRPDQDLSLPATAALLVGLLDELGIDRVDLIANDTGGAVAQVIAARYPERIRTLVLTNCDAHDNLPPEAFRVGKDLAEAGELAPVIRGLANDRDASRGIPGLGMGFADPQALSDQEVDALGLRVFADPARALELERFVRSTRVEDLLAVEAALAELQVPTLIVWGTTDIFFGIEWAHWLRDHIPGVESVVEIADGRLFFPYERAREFVEVLTTFLADHQPAAVTTGGTNR